MSAVNPRPESDDVAPLCLRLTHSGGEARNGVMRIPPAGAGLADALQLCGERQNDAQWRVANLCRIAWHGQGKGWQLSNGSHTLMCVRNGERVRGGTAVSLAVGDTLELGLLRFELEKDEGRFPERERVLAEAPPVPRSSVVDRKVAHPRPRVDGQNTFDLRDLDTRSIGSGGRQVDTLADPFGVLDIAGARSRPVMDTLAELLGEIPRSELRTVPHAARQASPLANAGPAALLDELHDEFVRVVQDPAQLAGRTDWEGFLAFGGEPAPTLAELRKQAESYALLRDILQPRESIDRIIEAFEPLVRSGLLDVDPAEDVLGLFAPELGRDARIPLPSLTRREHHELSPDSHVRIGSARVDEDEGEGAA
jgi:hypothetical protein